MPGLRRAGISPGPFIFELRHGLFEVLVDGLDEAFCREPLLLGADKDGEVFGHLAFFYGGDRHFFERFGKKFQLVIAIQLGPAA